MDEEIDYFAQRFNDAFSDDLNSNMDTIQKDIGFDKMTMYSPEYYKNIEPVKEKFTVDGEFDNNAFGKYYNKMLGEYNQVSSVKSYVQQGENQFLDTPTMRAIGIKNGLKATDVTKIGTYDSFTNQSLGVENFNKYSKGTSSIEEVIQQRPYYDEDGNKTDKTPEDYGMINNTFDQPLYKPKYEEDTIVDGKLFKKGSYKLDKDGLPYYQKLKEGDSLTHKEVLSSWDVSAREKDWWNDYNFMENDDLEKHMVGTIFSVGARLIPYANPYVGAVYTFTKVGLGLMDGLGALAKTNIGLAEGENAEDNKYYKMINDFQSKFETIGLSTTQNSKQNVFTLENLGNLIVSSIDQLKGQRMLGSMPRMIGLSNPTVAKALGASYMTLTQMSGIHKSFKEIGASEREAAAFTLGVSSVLGTMFVTTPIGNVALKSLDESTKIITNTIQSRVKNLVSFTSKSKVLEKGTTKGFSALVQSGKNTGKEIVERLKKIPKVSNVTDAMVLEGLEEGSEFLIQKGGEGAYNMFVDAKSDNGIAFISKGLKQLGFKGDKKTKFDKFKFDKIGQEFGLSVIGGALGGAVFKMHDVFLNLDQSTSTMEEFVKNGQTEELLKQLSKVGNKGFVDKKLSFKKDSEGNNLIYDENDATDKRLNDVIYDHTKDYIMSLDKVLTSNDIPVSSELQAQYDSILNKSLRKKTIRSHRYDLLIDAGFNTTLDDDLGDIFHQMVDIDSTIESLSKSEASLSGEQLQKLKDRKSILIEKLDNLKSGKEGKNYFVQALFMMNSQVNSKFGKIKTLNSFLIKNNVNKKTKELELLYMLKEKIKSSDLKSIDERIETVKKELSEVVNKSKEEYADYKVNSYKQDFKEAYKDFKDNFSNNKYFKAINNSDLTEMVGNYNDYYGEKGIAIKKELDPLNQFKGNVLSSFINSNFELSFNETSNEVIINENSFKVDDFVNKSEKLDTTLKSKINENVEAIKTNISKLLGDINFDFKDQSEIPQDVSGSIIYYLENSNPSDLKFLEGLNLYEGDVNIIKSFYIGNTIIPEKLELTKKYKKLVDLTKIIRNKETPSNELNEIFKLVNDKLKEQSKLIDVEGVGSYMIPSDLLDIKQDLEKVEGLIFASKEFNPAINDFNSESEFKEDPYKEYNEDEYLILRNYVKEITKKIKYLEDLDKFNKENLLSTILKEKSNMIFEMGQTLKDLASRLNISTDDYFDLYNLEKSSIDSILLKNAEIALSNLETKVFEENQNNPSVVKNYLKTLETSNVEDYNGSNNFNGDSLLSKSGLYNYVNTVIRFPSNDYNVYLKYAIENATEGQEVAPIFTQKYVMRQAFSAIVNNTSFALTNNEKLNFDSSIFLRSRDGAGKTKVMTPLLLEMLNVHYKDSVKVNITAPFKEQVANLSDDLDDKWKNSIITNFETLFNNSFKSNIKKVNEFLATIDSENEASKVIEVKINNFIDTVNVDALKKHVNDKDTKDLNLVILDEATLVDPVKLKLIDAYYTKLNSLNPKKKFKILAVGDPDQTGFITADGKEFNIGTERIEETNKAMISMRSLYEPIFDFNVHIKAELKTYAGKKDFSKPIDNVMKPIYYQGNNKGLINVNASHDLAIEAIEKAREEGLISVTERMLVIGKIPSFISDTLKEDEIRFVEEKERSQGLQANVVYFEDTNSSKIPYIKLQNYNTFLNRAKSLVLFKGDEMFEETVIKPESAVQRSTFMNSKGSLNLDLINELKEIELEMLSEIKPSGKINLPEPKVLVSKGFNPIEKGEKEDYDNDQEEGTVFTWSFYTPTSEANTEDELIDLIHIKSMLLGYSDVSKDVESRFNMSETEYFLSGKKYDAKTDSPKEGIGFESDEEYELSNGDGFVTIKAKLKSLNSEPDKIITLSVFPKLDNLTKDGSTVGDRILANQGKGLVTRIEELQGKAIGGFNIELGKDSSILFDVSNSTLGKYYYGKTSFEQFAIDNPHISKTTVIFTDSRDDVNKDLEKYIGRPLMIWSYGEHSNSELVDMFINDNKNIGIHYINTKEFDFEKSIYDLASIIKIDSTKEEQFKRLARGLLSLKSASDLNKILYNLAQKSEFDYLKVAIEKGLLIDPNTTNPGLMLGKYTKPKLFSLFIELARIQNDKYLDKSIFTFEIFNQLKGNANLIKNLADSIKLDKDSNLFVNAVINNEKTANSNSIVAEVGNPNDLDFNLKRITMPTLYVKFNDIIKEIAKKEEKQKIKEIIKPLSKESKKVFKAESLEEISNNNGLIVKKEDIGDSVMVSYLKTDGVKVEEVKTKIMKKEDVVDGVKTYDPSATTMENVTAVSSIDGFDKYRNELTELATSVDRLQEVQNFITLIEGNSNELDILIGILNFADNQDLYNKLTQIDKFYC